MAKFKAGKKGRNKAIKKATEAIDNGQTAIILSVGKSKLKGYNSISAFDPEAKRTVAILMEEDDLNIKADTPEAAMQACVMLMGIIESIEPILPERIEECCQLDSLIKLLQDDL